MIAYLTLCYIRAGEDAETLEEESGELMEGQQDIMALEKVHITKDAFRTLLDKSKTDQLASFLFQAVVDHSKLHLLV